jgi:GrpB-like predicted nucleotidyltransferase (UPF0157 family)
MQKYIFKPYSPIFSELFEKEKQRLSKYLTGNYKIEHIGSTAVPGLGGKGIIDIYIVAPRKDLERISKELISAGYEYRPKGSRLVQHVYHRIDLPDPIEGTRRYHMHLNYLEAKDFKKALAFRDYLREHPKEAKEYAKVKKKAIKEGKRETLSYLAAKSSIIQEILKKAF